jgi:hypothetical protein
MIHLPEIAAFYLVVKESHNSLILVVTQVRHEINFCYKPANA